MASKEFENKLILEEIEISDDDDDDSTDTQFKIDYELDGELMDLRLFPQNIMYEALGADWIAERNGITDPFLYKICEEVAKQPMKSLGEQWEEQKQKRSDFLEINKIINIDKLYTE